VRLLPPQVATPTGEKQIGSMGDKDGLPSLPFLFAINAKPGY
jgi:hypothetical protein